jgi:hypothetical protein
LSWNSEQPSYANTEHSFLFALRSRQDGGNILSVCKDYSSAIVNNSSYGPSFGGNDLTVYGPWEGNFAVQKSYSTPIRRHGGFFDIQEIEIFQVQS